MSPTRRWPAATARAATSPPPLSSRRASASAEQEIVEVVAAHYVAAYEAQPDADDAAEIKAKAREHLARAGERAGSLAAVGEARRSFEHAAELADEPLERARLLERAGFMAVSAVEYEPAERAFAQALALLEDAGERHADSSRLGESCVRRGAHRAGRPGARAPRESLCRRGRRRAGRRHRRARVAARAMYAFAGELKRAVEPTELALSVSEALRLPETLLRALRVKAIIARSNRRPEEELAFLRHSIAYAARARPTQSSRPRLQEPLRRLLLRRPLRRGARRPRARGSRSSVVSAIAAASSSRSAKRATRSAMTGHWNEGLAAASEIPAEQLETGGQHCERAYGARGGARPSGARSWMRESSCPSSATSRARSKSWTARSTRRLEPRWSTQRGATRAHSSKGLPPSRAPTR